MYSLEEIKTKIERLYRKAPNIHVSVNLSHPRLVIKESQAVIVGVYSNIFLIEERDSGYPRTHSLQYIDVLTKQIVIAELDN